MKMKLTKIQKTNEKETFVDVKSSVTGDLYLPTQLMIDFLDNKIELEDMTFDDLYYLAEDNVYAKIGHPILVKDKGIYNWIKTSNIKSFFKKDSDNDKLILPKDFPLEVINLLKEIKITSNMIVYLTQNSIYLGEILE